jgi:hypothetical protein
MRRTIMATQLSFPVPLHLESQTRQKSASLWEGMIAGTIGAATLILWFLILDTIRGQVLYTPTVLGTVLFNGGAGLAAPQSLAGSVETVVGYTWMHWLVFVALGGMASRLLTHAERHPDLGFGVLLLFVMFEAGFLAIITLFAQSVLHALAWQTVCVGNLLAAIAMGGYFRYRHPHLVIQP